MTQFAELREADKRECIAAGLLPEQALQASIDASDQCFKMVGPDGEILAYWGYTVGSPLTWACFAWMLSTPAIERNKMYAGRISLRLLEQLLDTYGEVFVTVHNEYGLSIRWLEWMGFHLFSPGPIFSQYRCVNTGSLN